jgi:tetratricopeptide (TPR) repeat protein
VGCGDLYMKPLGTITKYYPFIDDESISILNSIISDSSSYYDFVQRLTETVLHNDVPENLAYIAAAQAWWCKAENLINQIHNKYGHIQWINPWSFHILSIAKDQVEQHDNVVRAIELGIKSSQKRWIETELHLLHAFFHHPMGDVTSLYEPLEKVKVLIASNPELRCFESLIYAFESLAKAKEEGFEESIQTAQRGISLAKEYNDKLYLYMNLLQKGNILTAYLKVKDSTSVFEELYELVQDLESPMLLCEVLHDVTLLFEISGEFDLGLSSVFDLIEIQGVVLPTDAVWILLSRVYATLGNGERALKWMNKCFESCGQFERPMMHCYRAWAFALLDQIDQAEQSLEKAHLLVIKSGQERRLGIYYHIAGVIELRKGNILDAMNLLEKALDITERNPIDKVRVFLDLVRAEIAMGIQSRDDTSTVCPGKWLSGLETFASDHEMPGIRMYAALLKSEFYQKNGQLKDACATLEDSLKITDSLGVETLRKRIKKRIQEIEDLIHDEELVQ